MSRRAWVLVVFTLLWVMFGFMILSMVRVGGLILALPFFGLFIVAVTALWSERKKNPPYAEWWRLWLAWLLALVWTALVAVARFYNPDDIQAGLGRLALAIFGSTAEGLELALRDVYLVISLGLLIWSGIKLSLATSRIRRSS